MVGRISTWKPVHRPTLSATPRRARARARVPARIGTRCRGFHERSRRPPRVRLARRLVRSRASAALPRFAGGVDRPARVPDRVAQRGGFARHLARCGPRRQVWRVVARPGPPGDLGRPLRDRRGRADALRSTPSGTPSALASRTSAGRLGTARPYSIFCKYVVSQSMASATCACVIWRRWRSRVTLTPMVLRSAPVSSSITRTCVGGGWSD